MAQRCTLCGKQPQVGHTVSHSNIKTLRRFNPNLQKKAEVVHPATGEIMEGRICTNCLRTLVKPPRRRNPRVRTAQVRTGAKAAA